MSSIKTPQEKKRLSLELDRRNVYGENSKASRKNIKKGKQRSHMEERRTGNAPLLGLRGKPDEDTARESELKAKQLMIHAKHEAFKKQPDLPLGVVLKGKRNPGRRYSIIIPSSE